MIFPDIVMTSLHLNKRISISWGRYIYHTNGATEFLHSARVEPLEWKGGEWVLYIVFYSGHQLLFTGSHSLSSWNLCSYSKIHYYWHNNQLINDNGHHSLAFSLPSPKSEGRCTYAANAPNPHVLRINPPWMVYLKAHLTILALHQQPTLTPSFFLTRGQYSNCLPPMPVWRTFQLEKWYLWQYAINYL